MIDLPLRLTHSLSLRGSFFLFGYSLLSLSPKRRQAIPPPRLIPLARLQIEAHPSPLPGTRAPHWPSNGRERWCQFSNASIASAGEEDPAPVHIVHFGDSHSAADDWTGELRRLLKEKFGDGGSGFSLAGRPFAGYHRYDVQEGGSAGWRSDGLRSASGDGFFGLGGISSSARARRVNRYSLTPIAITWRSTTCSNPMVGIWPYTITMNCCRSSRRAVNWAQESIPINRPNGGRITSY